PGLRVRGQDGRHRYALRVVKKSSASRKPQATRRSCGSKHVLLDGRPGPRAILTPSDFPDPFARRAPHSWSFLVRPSTLFWLRCPPCRPRKSPRRARNSEAALRRPIVATFNFALSHFVVSRALRRPRGMPTDISFV